MALIGIINSCEEATQEQIMQLLVALSNLQGAD